MDSGRFFCFCFIVLTWLANTAVNGVLMERGGVRGTINLLGNARVLVYAPQMLKTDAAYKVIARQFYGSDDLSIFAKIIAKSNSTGKAIIVKENGGALSKSGGLTEIDLTMPSSFLKDTYEHELEVEVDDPVSNSSLSKSWHIDYHDKEVFILIQPDKSIYRQGDKVSFRVVTVDENLIPKDVAATVSIEDSNRKNVQIHKRISKKFSKYPGYFEDSFVLPIAAAPGNWTIRVTVHDTVEEKLIWVRQYEPRQFDVSLQMPQYILADASHFPLAVLAKYYSSGKPSSGEAEFSVTGPNGRSFKYNSQLVNGKGSVSIPLPNLLSNTELIVTSTYYIEISATVIDNIYRYKRDVSGTIPLHVTPYKINFIKPADFFRPTYTYSLQIQVTQHNGKPLHFDRTLDAYKELEIFMSPKKAAIGRSVVKKTTSKGDKVLENFTIDLKPKSTTQRIDVFYQIGDLRDNVTLLAADRSDTEDFIDITVLKPDRHNPRLQEFSIMCNCSAFDYVVISHGNIILAGTHDMEERRFSFETTDAMAPKSTLIAYYYSHSQNPVMAYSDFHVTRTGLSEEVVLNATWKSKTRDNQHRYSDLDKTISIHAAALPNSLVAFLAVDSRLATVDHVHNITEDKVINKILEARHLGFTNMHLKRIGGRNLHKFLKVSGCVAHEFNFARPNSHLEEPVTSYLSCTDDLCAPPPSPNAVLARMDFRDSFLFITGRANRDGDVQLDTVIPDTLTTWVFTAFSISPEGIGFMKKATELSSRQNLYVDFDLPHSLEVGKRANFKVFVYNHASTNEHAVLEYRFALNNRTLEDYIRPSMDFVVYANSVNSTLLVIPSDKPGILEVAVTVRTMENLDPVIKTMVIRNSEDDNIVET
ncbi:thioester-containing protein 1 allele S1-like [Paramacrobiotus metropolitanus]|uniref:thioester-containing protein 1 allele S1-like n=1 Tax=Paramacrobiotus metropolitanus TaxID=2943436 RepID=UPI002446389E|nr:thioester-containing protein 1 allele S1-like [Paramacrobiotus metropolitanus]